MERNSDSLNTENKSNSGLQMSMERDFPPERRSLGDYLSVVSAKVVIVKSHVWRGL